MTDSVGRQAPGTAARWRRPTGRLAGSSGVLVGVGLLLAGCGSGSGAAPSDTGVAGRTVVDVGCPVQRADTGCPQRPVRAKITVTRPDATDVVAAGDTDAQGRFRIALPAGTYVLHPVNAANAALPRAAAVRVTVQAGGMRQVVISFDSGVRSPIPGG